MMTSNYGTNCYYCGGDGFGENEDAHLCLQCIVNFKKTNETMRKRVYRAKKKYESMQSNTKTEANALAAQKTKWEEASEARLALKKQHAKDGTPPPFKKARLSQAIAEGNSENLKVLSLENVDGKRVIQIERTSARYSEQLAIHEAKNTLDAVKDTLQLIHQVRGLGTDGSIEIGGKSRAPISSVIYESEYPLWDGEYDDEGRLCGGDYRDYRDGSAKSTTLPAITNGKQEAKNTWTSEDNPSDAIQGVTKELTAVTTMLEKIGNPTRAQQYLVSLLKSLEEKADTKMEGEGLSGKLEMETKDEAYRIDIAPNGLIRVKDMSSMEFNPNVLKDINDGIANIRDSLQLIIREVLFRDKKKEETIHNYVRDRIASETKGSCEMSCEHGIVDVVNAADLVEVKHSYQWKAGIGQLCAYSTDPKFEGKRKRLHLICYGEPIEERHVAMARKTAKHIGGDDFYVTSEQWQSSV